MLQEIIYNLCDNAIKYNVPGGSVTIHAEKNRLVVSDTGIGIPAEHKDRIFERFYRVDKSHSKASGGTGLGLSIVKHAAAYHNAEISLESTPDKGTTVTVQF
jgi:two-component system phosphate regulon sensor histidine kinase PhoR